MWFAYFLAKSTATSRNHFHGKASQSRLITDLENETVASRKSLAARIAGEIPTVVLEEKVNNLYNRRIKPLTHGKMPQVTGKKSRKYRVRFLLLF